MVGEVDNIQRHCMVREVDNRQICGKHVCVYILWGFVRMGDMLVPICT